MLHASEPSLLVKQKVWLSITNASLAALMTIPQTTTTIISPKQQASSCFLYFIEICFWIIKTRNVFKRDTT